MKQENETHLLLSVRDVNGSREAHNLFEKRLADTVRPWFDDFSDEKVYRAINQLDKPSKRDGAAKFLGLEIRAAEPLAA